MSSLQARIEPVQGVDNAVIIHLNGILDQPTLGTFREHLDRARDDGKHLAVLDMSGVSYANSTTLGELVTQADSFRDAGGELVLLKPQPKVDLVIDMLGLSTLFKIFRTEAEALRYIGSPEDATSSAGTAAGQQSDAGDPAVVAFPTRAACIGCGILLEFTQPSHFRCPRCYSVYRVDPAGHIAGSKPRGGQPIELNLTCQADALEAFRHFVGALPQWSSYTDAEREQLEKAIGEVCDTIHQKAYEGDDSGLLRVLILRRDDGLSLRLADSGKTLSAAEFPLAAEVMTEFEHKPHPTRGNILRMTKKAS